MSSVVNPFTGRWVMEPKPQNVWGIPHSIWFALMGVGGALFLDRALFGIDLGRVLGLSVADVLSLVLISIGGLILIGDLGRPWRVLRALSNPRTSWISVGAICDFTFLVLDGLWTIADLDIGGAHPLAGLPWAGSSPLGIVFQVVAGLAALMVILYPGLVLAYSPSIPFWNTTLIPLQFLAYAFSSAIGLALLFAVQFPVASGTLHTWAAFEGGLMVVCLLLLAAHVLNAQYTHTASRASASRLLRGVLRWAFVLGTLVVGLGVPSLLSAWGFSAAPTLDPRLPLAAAGLVAIAGNWFSKYTVIRAGMYAPFL